MPKYEVTTKKTYIVDFPEEDTAKVIKAIQTDPDSMFLNATLQTEEEIKTVQKLCKSRYYKEGFSKNQIEKSPFNELNIENPRIKGPVLVLRDYGTEQELPESYICCDTNDGLKLISCDVFTLSLNKMTIAKDVTLFDFIMSYVECAYTLTWEEFKELPDTKLSRYIDLNGDLRIDILQGDKVKEHCLIRTLKDPKYLGFFSKSKYQAIYKNIQRYTKSASLESIIKRYRE